MGYAMNEFDFFYPHDVIVQRSLNEFDDEGNELFTVLYSGKGGLQIQGSGDVSYQQGVFLSRPLVILPITDVGFKINDVVLVELPNGIIYEYTVKSPKTETFIDVEGTTLWLKSGDEV